MAEKSERHDPFQARAVWPPEPGVFKLRLVKGAWEVPAQIDLDAGGLWRATIDGEQKPPHQRPELAEGVSAIWHGGTKVRPDDYRWRTELKLWAAHSDPDHPCLHPRKAISHMRTRPIITRKD